MPPKRGLRRSQAVDAVGGVLEKLPEAQPAVLPQGSVNVDGDSGILERLEDIPAAVPPQNFVAWFCSKISWRRYDDMEKRTESATKKFETTMKVSVDLREVSEKAGNTLLLSTLARDDIKKLHDKAVVKFEENLQNQVDAFAEHEDAKTEFEKKKSVSTKGGIEGLTARVQRLSAPVLKAKAKKKAAGDQVKNSAEKAAQKLADLEASNTVVGVLQTAFETAESNHNEAFRIAQNDAEEAAVLLLAKSAQEHKRAMEVAAVDVQNANKRLRTDAKAVFGMVEGYCHKVKGVGLEDVQNLALPILAYPPKEQAALK